jgi:hypothetical protein
VLAKKLEIFRFTTALITCGRRIWVFLFDDDCSDMT